MKRIPSAAVMAVAAGLVLLGAVAAQDTPPRPAPSAPQVLQAIVNEASGELALQSEISLAGFVRNRKAEEYRTGYFESAYVLAKLREYGLDEAYTVDLPVQGRTTWDAEAAELWMVEPELRKITDLDSVPACLCSGSESTDTTAELVYVGPGNREEFYKNKDVEGKILLVNGSPEMARRIGVLKHGAAGLVGWSSSHPEFDRDEVGWSGLRPAEKDRATFGFMISERQGQDLRDSLERGERVVLRAVARAQLVEGYKDQLTVGLIKGTERPDEELVFTAHLYEGWAKQGANDNASGAAAILETARVLKKLTTEGRIPPLKRSVRFLFVPEISGTAAYLRLNPDIRKRIFADINLDMVGEGLIMNRSYFRLNQTPWSLPTYLNDVMASYIEWMGDSQRDAQEANWATGGVLAPTGSRDPFYFLVERYSGGSDHDVFVDGGIRIPAVLMIVWPDQWYHTSADTPDKSDATQFKRVVAISAAAGEFLANAGPAEASRIMAEISARQGGRLGDDRARAERLLLAADAKSIRQAAREARVLATQGVVREKKTLASVGFFLHGDAAAEAVLAGRLARLDAVLASYLKDIDDLCAARCRALGVKTGKAAPTADEARLAGLVPVRTDKPGGMMALWELRDEIRKLDYRPSPSIMKAERELRNFVDGERSILDIRDAASAEFEPLDLLEVEKWVGIQEKLGLVTIRKK
ncbi:MAG TPA: M28 family peptidase [Candidatus Aminicenantes bacterium]|nr:M28 family peptidase [Candidatus Aminicenantes bacterium]HRY64623.1 M28 family peptidase [Candidatus Aminicenantes bacterium]HRZ71536.1 M28 family peptidase [Candidatus Aminicenantes bacterium]